MRHAKSVSGINRTFCQQQVYLISNHRENQFDLTAAPFEIIKTDELIDKQPPDEQLLIVTVA